MTDYGGGVSNGYNNGAYEITNENVSYRPQLTVGNTLSFSLSAQGSGFVESEFAIELINLDQPVAPPGDPEESLATAVNINDWGSGFIATFECVLPATGTPEIDQFLIDFNYTGGGTPANGWMVSYNGSVESGFIAANGGYGMQSSGYVPPLTSGDTLGFSLQVQGAGYSEADFAVSCEVGEQG